MGHQVPLCQGPLISYLWNNQGRWRIVWHDATKGAGRAGRKTAGCSHGRHQEAFDAADVSLGEREAFSKGAKNKKLRAELLGCYVKLEESKAADARLAGGAGRSRYGTSFPDLLDEYLEDLKKDVAVRGELGGREGRAPYTLRDYADTAARFKAFLESGGCEGLTTGELSPEHLAEWRDHLVRSRSERTGKPLASPTVNKHLRQLRAMLNHYLDRQDRRPYFRSTQRALNKALEATTESRKAPIWFKPERLQAALEVTFKKSPDLLFRWVVTLMMTGARRHSAEAFMWSDVDFERKMITLRPTKTGRDRMIPFADALAPISPLFLELLAVWREAAPATWPRSASQSRVRPTPSSTRGRSLIGRRGAG